MEARLISALRLSAGALAVVGTFPPLFEYGFEMGQPETTSTVTGWGLYTSDIAIESTVLTGVPLVVAAVLLVAATVIGLRGSRWAAGLTLLGGGFLAGVVALISMEVVSIGTQAGPESFALKTTIGIGYWLLAAAAVLGLAAAVLALRGSATTAVPPESAAERTDPMIPVVRELPRDLEV